MKRLAFIFMMIFALNLLSEIKSGDCHELIPDADIAASSTTSLESQPKPTNNNSHEGHPHLCHFGHCGHLLIFSDTPILRAPVSASDWTSVNSVPPSRTLAPPYKPPII